MAKPNFPIVILEELYLHSKQINFMQFLEEKPNFMALLQAVHLRVIDHQLHVVTRRAISTEHLIIKLNFAIVGMLNKNRVGSHNIFFLVTLALVKLGAGVMVLWWKTVLFGVNFEARCVKCKGELFTKTTKRVDF